MSKYDRELLRAAIYTTTPDLRKVLGKNLNYCISSCIKVLKGEYITSVPETTEDIIKLSVSDLLPDGAEYSSIEEMTQCFNTELLNKLSGLSCKSLTLTQRYEDTFIDVTVERHLYSHEVKECWSEIDFYKKVEQALPAIMETYEKLQSAHKEG